MYIEPSLEKKVAFLIERQRTSLSNVLGIEFLHFAKDKVVGSMPVNQNTKQPFGLLHGGASVALAESLSSVGGWLNVDETKYATVGIEINANHIRSVKDGKVIGTATPIHKGRTTHVWEIKINTEDGKPVCASRCTLAVVPLK